MPDGTDAAGWRELVAGHDLEAHDKMVEYIGHVVGTDAVPPLYRELILFAAAATIRFRPSMHTHAERAVGEGATPQQLFQTAALSALTGGFTSLIEAVRVLEELGVDPDA